MTTEAIIPDDGNVPSEFRSNNEWTNWSPEVLSFTDHEKQPFYGPTRELSYTSPEGSGSYIRAIGHAYRHDNRGIGYVFKEDDGYVAIDLDGCLQGNGELKDWLPRPPWLTREHWAEVSFSETGLHTAVKGVDLPWWWSNNDFDDKDHVGVECYDGNRFFAFTGNLWKQHGTDIPEIDQDTFEAWLKEVYRTVEGKEPWEREPPQKSTEPTETDVELGIYDVISRSIPRGKKVEHPFHGSNSGINFQVDRDDETFRCWRHEVTGNAHHLLGMEAGVIDCGEWDNRKITDEEWVKIYDYGRAQGYEGVPDKKPQTEDVMMNYDDGWEETAAGYEAQYEAYQAEMVEDDQDTSQQAIQADGGTSWGKIRELYKSMEMNTTSEANHLTARKLIDQYNPKTVKNSGKQSDTIYYYDPDVGHYIDDGRYIVREVMTEKLGPQHSKSRMYEVLEKVRSLTYIDRDELQAPEGMICVKNGVLDISDPDNPQLLDHSPDYGFTWALDAKYDPDATNDQFLQFLDETVRETDVEKLQEYTGESLAHWEQPEKMAILLGPTNAGKGTYLHVIEDLFGMENVAAESIGRLADDRWAPNSLQGRPLNIANELSTDTLRHQEMVKTLTGGGDTIRAEEKGEPVYEFMPKSNHLFAANEVPDVPDGEEAFYNRWLFVTFPRTIPPEEQDRRLDNKLVGSETKRAGILNWLIEGYARSEEMAGRYTNEKPISEKMGSWRSFGSPVERFIETCLDTETACSNDVRTQKDLHMTYKEMCGETGMKVTESQSDLAEEIAKLPGVDETQPDAENVDEPVFTDSHRPRSLRGIKLTDRGQTLFNQVVEKNDMVKPISASPNHESEAF